jgi:nucleoside-diphosphate-sugar epimerase
MIQKEIKGKGGLNIKDTRVGEVDFYRADTENAEEDLKFKTKVDIKEGIKKTIKWYNENNI